MPGDLDDRQEIIFYVNGLVHSSGQRQVSAQFTLSPARALGAEEHGSAELSMGTARYGDRTFGARLALRGAALPPGAAGPTELPFDLSFLVSATDSPSFSGTLHLKAHAIVEEGRAHIISWSDAIPQHIFPGIGEYEQFEAHLSFFDSD